MKKLHILLMGATMILASPAMAEDAREMRSNNDNTRPAAIAPQAGSIDYADYTANDDDHGADDSEDNIHPAAASTDDAADSDDDNSGDKR